MSTDLRQALQDAAASPRRDLDVAGLYRRGRRRRQRKAVTALGAVLVVGMLGVGVVELNTPRTQFYEGGSAGEWAPVADAPLSPRYDHFDAWTGSEVIIWGGRDRSGEHHTDGAAYDPAADGWRRITDAPIPGRAAAATAWTGDELIVVGGWSTGTADADTERPSIAVDDGEFGTTRYHVDGAAYEPATDSWRTIADFPLDPRRDAASVWTGKELLVWGGYTVNVGPVEFFADGAAYDPATDSWRVLEDAPLAPRAGHAAVWTGSELLIYGGAVDMEVNTVSDGAAYDPETDTWRSIADGPSARGNPAMWFNGAGWTGEEMLVWFGQGEGGRYHPATDTWKPLAAAPFQGSRLVRARNVEWTGTHLLTWGGWTDTDLDDYGPQSDGAAYDPATDAWTLLPDSPLARRDGHSLTWTGQSMVVWGGETFGNRLLRVTGRDHIEALDDGGKYTPGF